MASTLVTVFLVLATTISLASSASFKNCNESLPVQFYFTMPDPLVVIPGEPFIISAGGNLREEISQPMKVKHVMHRMVGSQWVYLPCLFGVGSCTYDMSCQHLADMSTHGQKCPIEPGNYEEEPAKVPVPDMPMPAFMVNGMYRVHIEGYTQDMSRMLFCGDVTQEMKRGYHE